MLPPKLHRNSGKADTGKRSPAHRAWVRSHSCSVLGCSGRPIECAHVRIGGTGGIGVKPSDAHCISLCRDHHSESHRIGDVTFGIRYNIDMVQLARTFLDASPHRHKLHDHD